MNELNVNEINNISIVGNKLLIAEMKENYLNYVYSYYSLETFLCYKGHLELILNFLVERFNIVYDIDLLENHLLSFIKFQRLKHLTNSTINKRLNVLKRMFSYNKSTNNLIFIRNLKEDYTTFNYLNIDELKKLIDYIDNSKLNLQNKLMLCLFLESGVRRKELQNIEVKNVDLDNKIILLTTTKNKKPRYVCYNSLTDKYIQNYFDKVKNNKYLFNISNDGISSCFRRINKILNFKNFSPHVLRHSYATLIVNNNGNLEMLRQTLGHEQLTTTQRYIHYNKSFLLKAYKNSFKILKD